jgi:hypothetical protein
VTTRGNGRRPNATCQTATSPLLSPLVPTQTATLSVWPPSLSIKPRWAEAKKVGFFISPALAVFVLACWASLHLPPPRHLTHTPANPLRHPLNPKAGAAPPVILAATHIRALDYVSLADLQEHALDGEGEGGAGQCGGDGGAHAS